MLTMVPCYEANLDPGLMKVTILIIIQRKSIHQLNYLSCCIVLIAPNGMKLGLHYKELDRAQNFKL